MNVLAVQSTETVISRALIPPLSGGSIVAKVRMDRAGAVPCSVPVSRK